MSSAEWGPLAEVPSHLTGPVVLARSLWSGFGSQRSLCWVFWEHWSDIHLGLVCTGEPDPKHVHRRSCQHFGKITSHLWAVTSV